MVVEVTDWSLEFVLFSESFQMWVLNPTHHDSYGESSIRWVILDAQNSQKDERLRYNTIQYNWHLATRLNKTNVLHEGEST